ncbi:glycosyltransferase family 4 protein [Sphingomonas sp. Leaf4]|uniref:glycosyltransferase family 4 protein n=1 Tax=Sphingomonas sp. Leaf4 TaxID=2876553 RepID=UPI001E659BFB|nr:glycosyltransferase family 4 protein [Sphingomonas sp. Leaf4]
MPAPLRIAQVAPVIYPTPPGRTGGTERVVSDLTETLVAMGHDVTLIAPSDSITTAQHLSAHPSLRTLEQHHGTVAPGVPAALEAAQLGILRRYLDRFDMVHCHGEFAHAAVLGDRIGCSLTTVHWRLDELDRQLFFRSFPDLPVAAISAAQARDLPRSNHAGIVHHGIPPERFRAGPGGRGVAFIGRMTDQKRPDVAIRVARAAGRPIWLAGGIDVGNPRYFTDSVAPLLGDDAVHVGEVDDRAKQALLGEAAALLFPIDWPEPFGLVMIEAMACGTPVIAWDRGSAREVVEQGVTGFVVGSEDEAVAALERIETLDRARVRERFEARFTARRMAEDYVALYRQLIALR